MTCFCFGVRRERAAKDDRERERERREENIYALTLIPNLNEGREEARKRLVWLFDGVDNVTLIERCNNNRQIPGLIRYPT